MNNIAELQRVMDLLVRYVNKGNDLKNIDLTQSAFVTFGYEGEKESTIHDLVPVVFVYYISKTLANPNGYILGFNLHYVINKNIQKSSLRY